MQMCMHWHLTALFLQLGKNPCLCRQGYIERYMEKAGVRSRSVVGSTVLAIIFAGFDSYRVSSSSLKQVVIKMLNPAYILS